MTDALESVRIDRWLWAARLFKTRSQAARACGDGEVELNGVAVKAAKLVRAGDSLVVETAGGVRVVDVLAIAEKRGPAAVARALYDDKTPPAPPKDPDEYPVRERGAGRPVKRERRRMMRLRSRD